MLYLYGNSGRRRVKLLVSINSALIYIPRVLTGFLLRLDVRWKPRYPECQAERTGKRIAVANDEASWGLVLEEVNRCVNSNNTRRQLKQAEEKV